MFQDKTREGNNFYFKGFAIIRHSMMTLRTRSFHWNRKRACWYCETNHLWKGMYIYIYIYIYIYVSTITFIRQALVIRSLINYYLILTVATLFLLNGRFINLSSIIVCILLFTIIELFNLLSSQSSGGSFIAILVPCFSSLKLETWLKKNIDEIWISQTGCILLLFIIIDSISEFGCQWKWFKAEEFVENRLHQSISTYRFKHIARTI